MSDASSVATRILRSEHRSLGAMVHGIKAVVEQMRSGTVQPNYPLLWRMLYYIEAYPDKLHHPKEDQHLFPRLRLRCAEAASLIDTLDAQHRASEAHLNELRVALGHCEAGLPSAIAELSAAVDRYAEFYWRHMAMEEDELLPLAQAHLTDADWQAIAAAFEANNDPLEPSASADSFWKLLRDIVRMAPAPLGLGEAR